MAITTRTDVMRSAKASRWSTTLITVILAILALLGVWGLVNLIIKGQCGGPCAVETLSSMVRVATPIAFAAFTGLMCERSGIVNIGIEGQMLMAACVAYAVKVFAYQYFQTIVDIQTAKTLSLLLALLLAILSSLLLGWLLAVISIKFKVDQVIGGTVINILSMGLTGYVYHAFLAQNVPAGPGTFPVIPIPILSQIPIIGPVFFNQKPLTYLMLIMAFALHYILFFTPWGLRTRSVGEHPRAADTLGINVNRMRYINVILAGLLAGFGGAYFTLESVEVFNPLMTNGVGFIGLAAMIFGKYTPFGALGGALIFGLGDAINPKISMYRPDFPSQFPQMLPYLLTIIVLTGVVGRSVPPAAENQVYEKQ